MTEQVKLSHYDWHNYYNLARWDSLWAQIDIISRHCIYTDNIIELGPGKGFLKLICEQIGYKIITIDHDKSLRPDIVANLQNFDNVILDIDIDIDIDCICAFQILEHMPYQASISLLKGMIKHAQKKVFISIPNTGRAARVSFPIPKFRYIDFLLEFPAPSAIHQFDGEHYWELGKKGYSLNKFKKDIYDFCSVSCDFRLKQNPYHHFFVLERSL